MFGLLSHSSLSSNKTHQKSKHLWGRYPPFLWNNLSSREVASALALGLECLSISEGKRGLEGRYRQGQVPGLELQGPLLS